MLFESELKRLFPKSAVNLVGCLDSLGDYIGEQTDCDPTASKIHISLDSYGAYNLKFCFHYLWRGESIVAKFCIDPTGDYHLTLENKKYGAKKRFSGKINDNFHMYWDNIDFRYC